MKPSHAVVAAAALALALLVFGCEKPNEPPVVEQPPEPAQPAPFPRDQIPEPETPAAEARPQPSAQPDLTAQPAEQPPITTIEPAPAAPKPKVTTAKPRENYAPPPKSSRTYVVRKGDTLQKISRKFYGTTRNYRKIYQANKDKLESPDKLPVGVKLVIP